MEASEGSEGAIKRLEEQIQKENLMGRIIGGSNYEIIHRISKEKGMPMQDVLDRAIKLYAEAYEKTKEGYQTLLVLDERYMTREELKVP